VCIAFYLWGYHHPANHPSIMIALSHPVKAMEFFFAFLGSASLNFIPAGLKFKNHIPSLAGGILFIYYIFLIRKQYYKKNESLFLFLSFLIMTGLLVALGRTGFGVLHAWGSRYSHISALLLIGVYFSILEFLSAKRIRQIFSILFLLALVFNLSSYLKNYQRLVFHRQRMISSLENWRTHGSGLLDAHPRGAAFQLSRAIETKFYFLPDQKQDKEIP